MFELIVQAAFTERLEGTGVRVRKAGDRITAPAEIASALATHHAFVVKIPAEPKAPEPAGQASDIPATEPADAPAAQ